MRLWRLQPLFCELLVTPRTAGSNTTRSSVYPSKKHAPAGDEIPLPPGLAHRDRSLASGGGHLGGPTLGQLEQSRAGILDVIKDLLETRIRPAVAGDGGDITFRGFKDGIVFLAMKGSCAGCPSSTATLKHGIQNLLKHFLPDVREVQQI